MKKMDGRRIGVTILGCAALATGYGVCSSHNHRLEVALQEKTKQLQELSKQAEEETQQVRQREETRRFAVAAEALNSRETVLVSAIANELADRLAKRGHNAASLAAAEKLHASEATTALEAPAKNELVAPLTVSSTFNIVEVSKKSEPWLLQLRSTTRGDLTVSLPEDALGRNLAEVQRVIRTAFHAGRKVTAVVVCGPRKNWLTHVKLQEAAGSRRQSSLPDEILKISSLISNKTTTIGRP